MVKSHTHGMQHYHITDIQHTHGITDPGHEHNVNPDGNINFPIIWNNSSGSPFVQTNGYVNQGSSVTGNLLYATKRATGITINTLTEQEKRKMSEGSITSQGVGRTQTDSNNINANENRSENFTVKIWKRTA